MPRARYDNDLATTSSKLMSHFAFSPYRLLYNPCDYDSPDEWLEGQYKSFITNWARHVSEHLLNAKHYDIHPIFYERLLNDTPGGIELR